MEKYLIVGLGNPGKNYENTRHNVGFEVVKNFAKKNNGSFLQNKNMKGELCRIKTENSNIYLLMPMTFMNESGISVRLCIDFFKIESSHLLIIVDDADLAFGQMRLRKNSSTAGHKGLQSIEDHLHTDSYSRLRIGIGDKGRSDLASYVLGPFSKNEKANLPEVIQKATTAIELWLEKDFIDAMNQINVRTLKNQQEEIKE